MITSPRSKAVSPLAACILAGSIAALLAAPSANAANIWDGGGGDNNWATVANWDDNVLPGTGLLTFTGNIQPSTNNNRTAALTYAGINFTNDGSVGKTSAFTLAGNSITLGSGIGTTATTTGTISDVISLNLILNANRTVTTNSGHNLTISGTISESAVSNLTKAGIATLTLSGNTNSYTGTTAVSGGGTLVLDYGSGQDNSKIANAALNLNAGNLVLRGGSHVQAVTAINFNGNNYSSISREALSTATLAISTTLQGSGAGNTNSTLSISEGGFVSTLTSVNTNGILSVGKITIGSDFATKDGSNLVQVYTGYTTLAVGAGSGNIAVTNLLTGGGTSSGNKSSYALKIVNSADNDVLTLDTGHDLLFANGGTLLYAGGSNNNYTINGSATSDIRTTSNSVGLHMNIVTGATLTVNTKMASGNDGSGNFLVKNGAGTLVAGGANIYTGATIIQQGVFRLANNAGLGTTGGATSVQIGSVLELSQTTGGSPVDITVGAEALALNGTGISDGGALRNHSGSNTYGGAITIGGGGARINSNVSTSLTLTGGIVTASGQNVTFGGAGNTTVSTTAITGAGRVIKDGAGTTTLSAGVTHTYTGPTTVSDGTLSVTGSLTGTTAVNVTGGTLLLGANNVINDAATVSLGGGTLNTGGFSEGSPTTVGLGALTLSATSTLDFGAGNTSQLLFAGLGTHTGGTTLSILNWTSDLGGGSGEGTANDDRLMFVGVTSAFTALYAQADVSFNGGSGYQAIQFNIDHFEIVPIPEPSSTALLGAAGLLALVGYRERRRLARAEEPRSLARNFTRAGSGQTPMKSSLGFSPNGPGLWAKAQATFRGSRAGFPGMQQREAGLRAWLRNWRTMVGASGGVPPSSCHRKPGKL